MTSTKATTTTSTIATTTVDNIYAVATVTSNGATSFVEMSEMDRLGDDRPTNAINLTILWHANSTVDTITDNGHNNETCFGAPEYCNLTRAEYEEMLREFIDPNWPSMLLIGAHAVVFTMGLVGAYRHFLLLEPRNPIIIKRRLATLWCALLSTPTTRCAR